MAPWMGFWDHNYFGGWLPMLGEIMRSPYFRGAVTGVGLVTAFAGIRDLSATFLARHDAASAARGDR